MKQLGDGMSFVKKTTMQETAETGNCSRPCEKTLRGVDNRLQMVPNQREEGHEKENGDIRS